MEKSEPLVGIRELRSRLSAYLRVVAQGRTVTIGDRRRAAPDDVEVEIGVISDTHGLLRPEALAALAGVAHILHAGDVGDADVLAALGRVAPVTAVRGNNDRGAWAERLPGRTTVVLGETRVLLLHNRGDLRRGEPGDAADVVVTGHSHRPMLERCGALLHVNPGSAGPRRFTLPITLARLSLGPGGVTGRIVELTAAA